jgi:hypothetical protein
VMCSPTGDAQFCRRCFVVGMDFFQDLFVIRKCTIGGKTGSIWLLLVGREVYQFLLECVIGGHIVMAPTGIESWISGLR